MKYWVYTVLAQGERFKCYFWALNSMFCLHFDMLGWEERFTTMSDLLLAHAKHRCTVEEGVFILKAQTKIVLPVWFALMGPWLWCLNWQKYFVCPHVVVFVLSALLKCPCLPPLFPPSINSLLVHFRETTNNRLFPYRMQGKLCALLSADWNWLLICWNQQTTKSWQAFAPPSPK